MQISKLDLSNQEINYILAALNHFQSSYTNTEDMRRAGFWCFNEYAPLDRLEARNLYKKLKLWQNNRYRLRLNGHFVREIVAECFDYRGDRQIWVDTYKEKQFIPAQSEIGGWKQDYPDFRPVEQEIAQALTKL